MQTGAMLVAGVTLLGAGAAGLLLRQRDAAKSTSVPPRGSHGHA